jgi:hypothetical protein
VSRKLSDDEWNDLATIYGAGDLVSQLGATDFAKPWLDRRVRPVLVLEPLAAHASELPLGHTLPAALQALAERLAALGDHYARNTFPDPLIEADEWRFFDWQNREGVPGFSTPEGGPGSPAAEIRLLADGVGVAYQAVVDALGHDRKIRRHLGV